MEDSLESLHKKLTLEYIPLIVFMVCIGIIGILGNAVTIAFYGFRIKKKSSTTVFVTVLASLDLMTNLLISTTVADLFVNVYYSNRTVCKLMFFVDECFILSSVFVLWIISVDRYLKLCRPLGKQFSVQSAKITAVLIFIVAAVFASRLIVITDVVIREVLFNNTTVQAYDCANTEKDDLKAAVTTFHVLDFIVLCVIVGTFIFTYYNIQRKVKAHNNAVKTYQVVRFKAKKSAYAVNTNTSSSGVCIQTKDDRSECMNNSVDDKIDDSIDEGICETYIKSLERKTARTSNTMHCADNLGDSKLSLKNDNTTNRLAEKTERNITIMMFAVSVGLCFCFLPFVVWNMMIAVQPDFGKMELEPGVQFVLRSPFWNSVINPVIFCVFNPQYRKYMKRLFIRFCRKVRCQDK